MGEVKHGKCEECGKNYEEIETICGHCGYSPHGFSLKNADIPFWKCGGCGRIVQAQQPPEKCPGCGEVCDFKNVTCYTPECGGTGYVDPQLS